MSQNDGQYYRTGGQPSHSGTPAARTSRPATTYIGFYFWWWCGVTVLFVIGSLVTLAHDLVGTGLLGLLIAGLSALYTRYLYRGGRFRMIFIIF
ncbi:hypothetical protein [Actinomadura sp. BRA 177]|jgi:hypothetical protein|uniref:hypothetical protein n=1 Tax=Actinomadura sp. BRA 177 TaxID=2745202 RepID=UPI001596129F|nr:hypothetical protein [Actinomadura sp. BRA 177]NVI89294.1 hypothetical protein [Actinomadura sp. BRA 177]